VTFDGRANDGAPRQGDNADAEVVLAPAVAGPAPVPAARSAAPAAAARPSAPLAVPTPAPLPAAVVAGATRAVRAPAAITRAALRRRGVRVAVTCRPTCRVTLKLTSAASSRPPLVSRSAVAGPGTTAVVLRPRRGATLPRTGGLAVRATFAPGAASVRRIALR
jgi:hypothetical protein